MFLICLLPFAGKKVAKQEDLKEMGDVSSGMSSSIMQLYLKQVLEAFFHTQSSVRHFALNVIALTLNQGLIHPVQVSLFDSGSTYWKNQICYHLMTLWLYNTSSLFILVVNFLSIQDKKESIS